MVVAKVENSGKSSILVDRIHTLNPGQSVSINSADAYLQVDCGITKYISVDTNTTVYVKCGVARSSECKAYGPKNIWYSRNNTTKCFERYYIDVLTRKN